MAEPTAASDSPLSDLIGAVLIDLARAQHESNVYSARLGEIYKRDPLLRPFPVPNGYVTSADITIKLAIGDLGSGLAGPEARLARAQAEFDAFVTRLVPQATALLARALVENADAFPSDTADWLAKTLAETSLQRRLAADVRERVHPVVSQAVSTAGELRWDLAQPAVAAALRDVVVDHGDYARLPQAARQRVYDQIAALTENAPRADALRERLAAFSETEPAIRIVAATHAIVSIGSDVLASLTFNGSVRDFLVEAAPDSIPPPGSPPGPVQYRLVRATH